MSKQPTCSDAVRGMMLSDLPAKPFPDDKEFPICVSEVISPNLFYGQLATDGGIQVLQEVTLELASCYSDEEQLSGFTPKINEMCVAKFEDDQWYRASVIQYNADLTARVFFVDFGNKCDVETKNIRCIKEHLLHYPRIALKFSLSGIESTQNLWSDKVIEFMKTECASSFLNVTCVSVQSDLMQCTLQLQSDGEQLEKKLLSQGYAQRKKAPELQIGFPSEDAFCVLMMHVKDTSLFHGQLLTEDNLKEMTYMGQRFLEVFAQPSSSAYIPKVGDVCAGYHDDFQEWYRIRILEIQENDNVLVKLLDYGDELPMQLSKLRSLPEDFYNIPLKAIPMSLSDVEPIEGAGNKTACVEKLKEHFHQKRCVVEVIQRSNQQLQVKVTSDNIDTHELLSSFLQQTKTKTIPSDPTTPTVPTSSSSITAPLATPKTTTVPSTTKIVMSADIPEGAVPDNGEMLVTNVETPECIHGQLVVNLQDIQQLDVISSDLTSKFKDSKAIYQPVVGEACAAYYSTFGEYYRALILKVNNDSTALVQFCDYGNCATVPFNCIDSLPVQHSKTPMQAVHFSLYDTTSEQWSEECKQNLRTVLSNKLATYNVKERKGQIMIADIQLDGRDINAEFRRFFVTPSSKKTNGKLDEYTNLEAYEIPNECDVSIQHIESTDLFFAQHATQENQITVSTLSQEMYDYCNNLTEPYEPKMNELCCGIFDGIWNRCFVTAKNSSSVTVFFIDFGNRSEIPFSGLRKISPMFVRVPSLALPFRLSISSESSTSKFNELALNNVFEMKMMNRNSHVMEVQLFDRQTGDNIADCLLESTQEPSTPQTQASRPAVPLVRLMEADIPEVFVPETGQLMVVDVENPSCINAIDYQQIAQLDSLSEDLTNALKDSKVMYQPSIGEACVAFFANFNQYFRVGILKLNSDETVEVQSMDFGNKTTVSFADIAPLPVEYSTLPKQAVWFSLEGIEESKWCVEYNLELQTLLTNKMVTYKVKRKIGRTIIADLQTKQGNIDIDVVTFFNDLYSVTAKQVTHNSAPTNTISTASTTSNEIKTPATPTQEPAENDQSKLSTTVVQEPPKTNQIKPSVSKAQEPPTSNQTNLSATSAQQSATSDHVKSSATLIQEPSAKPSAAIAPIKALVESSSRKSMSSVSPKDVEELTASMSTITKANEIKPPATPTQEPAENDHSKLSTTVVQEPPKTNLIKPSVSKAQEPPTSNQTNLSATSAQQSATSDHVKSSATPIQEPSAKPSAAIAPTKALVEPSSSKSMSSASPKDVEELTASMSTITKANYAPIARDQPTKAIITEQPRTVPTCNNFTKSMLPLNVHPLESVGMKMDVRNLSSGTYELRVEFAESPYLIYGTILDKEMTRQLENISNDMTNCFSSEIDEHFEQNFKAGSLCAIQTEGVWKRAIIKAITEESVTVFLIDHGNEMETQLSQLKPLLKQFKSVPAQAIALKLITVKPINDQKEWSNEICNFLKEIITGQTVRVKPEYKDGVLFAVRMKVGSQPLDKLLEEAGYAQRIEPELPQVAAANASSSSRPERKAIPFSDVSKVIVMERCQDTEFEAYVTCAVSPRLFYCRLLDNSKDKKVNEIGRQLKTEFENKDNDDHEFSDGTLCSLKLSDNKWYRGFILKIYSNDSVNVWLIDYGSKYQVDKSTIYPLPEVYREFPAQCITLQLQYTIPTEETGYTKEACERFKKLVFDRVMVIKVLKIHDTILRVLVTDKKTGTDVGEKLVEEGHAKFIYYDKRPNQQKHFPKNQQTTPIHHHSRPQASRNTSHPDPYQEPDPYYEDPYTQNEHHYHQQSQRGRSMYRGGRGQQQQRGAMPTRGMGRGSVKYPFSQNTPHNDRSPSNGNYKYSPNRVNDKRPPGYENNYPDQRSSNNYPNHQSPANSYSNQRPQQSPTNAYNNYPDQRPSSHQSPSNGYNGYPDHHRRSPPKQYNNNTQQHYNAAYEEEHTYDPYAHQPRSPSSFTPTRGGRGNMRGTGYFRGRGVVRGGF